LKTVSQFSWKDQKTPWKSVELISRREFKLRFSLNRQALIFLAWHDRPSSYFHCFQMRFSVSKFCLKPIPTMFINVKNIIYACNSVEDRLNKMNYLLAVIPRFTFNYDPWPMPLYNGHFRIASPSFVCHCNLYSWFLQRNFVSVYLEKYIVINFYNFQLYIGLVSEDLCQLFWSSFLVLIRTFIRYIEFYSKLVGHNAHFCLRGKCIVY
jgi:hypothetical protein